MRIISHEFRAITGYAILLKNTGSKSEPYDIEGTELADVRQCMPNVPVSSAA